MLLVLLSSCICIIEVVGQMMCWEQLQGSAMLSHMACQRVAVQSVHLLVPCSQVAVTWTSTCTASSCARTARHMYCSTASNRHLADTPTWYLASHDARIHKQVVVGAGLHDLAGKQTLL